MRRLLLIICVMSITGLGFAQQPNKMTDQKVSLNIPSADGTAMKQSSNDRVQYGRRGGPFQPTVIWEEDFSNGIPPDWKNIGTISGLDTSGWEYRGTNTTPDLTIGTRGQYGLNRRLASATVLNGFVIYDSDYWDNGGIAGNDGNGPVPAPHFGDLITGVIDLTNEPEVKLEMYQHMRYFASTTDIFVSIDGGATWLPDTIHLNLDIERNDSNDDDDYVSIDISSMAGGQANVKIRFNFNSFTLSNGLAGYYFWQLDDLRIIRKPNNDLIMSDIAIDQGQTDVFYGWMPQSQVQATTFRALISNIGSTDQPNTLSKVDVERNASGVHTESGTAALLMKDSSRIDDLNVTSLTPTSLGIYDATFEVSSDSTDASREYMPENNFDVRSFVTSDSIFSCDTDEISGSLGTGSFTGATEDYRMANLIEVQVADTITSVYVGIRASRTVPGGLIRIAIRDSTGGSYATDFPVISCLSDFHTVTAQDTANGYVILPIPALLNGTPQNRILVPGWYYVSAEMFSNGNQNDIYIWDDGSVEQVWWASIIYVPQDRWYSNGNAFHIRANFGDVEEIIQPGIEDLEVNLTISPNPAYSYINIDMESEAVNDYTVVITNISGQVMKRKGFTNTNSIHTNIEIADYAQGIYFVQIISADNEMITKKLVVQK